MKLYNPENALFDNARTFSVFYTFMSNDSNQTLCDIYNALFNFSELLVTSYKRYPRKTWLWIIDFVFELAHRVYKEEIADTTISLNGVNEWVLRFLNMK